MAADYAYVALFLIVGALFVVFNIDILSRLIRPAKPTPVKKSSASSFKPPPIRQSI